MTKIVHIITGLRYGGAEKMLYLTCKWMLRFDVQIHIIYFDSFAPMRPYFEMLGIECRQLNRSFSGFAALVRFLRDQRFDVVHTHLIHADTLGRIAAILSRAKSKVFTTVHGTEWFRQENHLFPIIVRGLDRLLSLPANHFIIAVSQSVHDVLVFREKINPKKIYIIYNAVEIDRPKKGSMSSDFKVLFVGRLSVEKNIPCLLRAVSQLLSLDIKLTIVGDGDQKENLEQLVEQLNLKQHVTFIRGRFDVDDFYRSHDVLVLPSLREGLGIVILEAFRFAMPVIGSNVEGIAELLADGRGLLFEGNNPGDLAQKINWLYTHRYDELLLGHVGYEYVRKNHSIEDYVEELIKLYKNSNDDRARW